MNKYKWIWKAHTQKELYYGTCTSQEGTYCHPEEDNYPFNIEEYRQQVKDNITTVALQKFKELANQKKLDVRVLSYTTKVTIDERRVFRKVNVLWGTVNETDLYLTTRPEVEITFESPQYFTASPIDPVLTAAILMVIKAIILGLVFIAVTWIIADQVRRHFDSITTDTSKVHTIYYDEEGNVVKETWEETTTPNIAGILSSSLPIVIIIIIALLFFVGIGKLRR